MITPFSVCALLGLLSGPASDLAPQASQDDPQEQPVLELTFGVYQTDKATTLYRQFTPTLEVLQERLELELGREVDIQLRIYKTYDEGIDALAEGSVDFVRFGPASYITAHARQPEVQLLAMEHKDGKKRFNGVIVVRADSDITRLSDLRGKRFAFGDPNSTIGRYLVQDLLVEAGIFAKDLGGSGYLGRHDKVALAVAIGDYDAGALKKSTLKAVDQQGRLRVLTTFENVTKPWIARAGLETKAVRAISQALIGMQAGDALEALGVSGFLPTSDAEYAFVRRAMRGSREFEGIASRSQGR